MYYHRGFNKKADHFCKFRYCFPFLIFLFLEEEISLIPISIPHILKLYMYVWKINKHIWTKYMTDVVCQ